MAGPRELDWNPAGGWFIISSLLGVAVGSLTTTAVDLLFRPEGVAALLFGIAVGLSVGALHGAVGIAAQKILAGIAELETRNATEGSVS